MSKRGFTPGDKDTDASASDSSGARHTQQEALGLGSFVSRLLDKDSGMKDQIDRNARALAQAALGKLDVVSRQEFDAQSAVLQRTRERVIELEAELERLGHLLKAKPPQ